MLGATGPPAHACAILGDRTVECWGFNGQGQIGDGTVELASSPVQVQGTGGDAPLGDVRGIGAGGFHGDEARGHTCAVVGDAGELY